MLTHLSSFVRHAGATTLDLLFPPPLPCSLCRAPLPVTSEVGVCTTCLERLGRIDAHRCDRCGRAIMRPPRRRRREPALCRQCGTAPPAIDYARSYGSYQGTCGPASTPSNTGAISSVATALGELMAWIVAVDPAFTGVRLIVPVPLHPKRLRERGYNQAAELAKVVGERSGCQSARRSYGSGRRCRNPA